MKPKHKYVPLYFSYTRCDDFAAFLSDMAAKGWKLLSLGAFMKFEEAEPAEEVYDVQVFLKNWENDFVPTQNTLEFSDYCTAAGWEMIDSYRKYVVFKKIRNDAIPILSSEEKINSVFRASMRIYLQMFLIMAFYTILWFGFNMNIRPDVFFFHPMPPVISLVAAAIAVCSLVSILWLFLWRRQKTKLLQTDNDIYIGKRNFRTGTAVVKWFIPVLLAILYLATGNPAGIFLVLLAGELVLLVIIIIVRPNAGGSFLISIIGNIAVFFIAVVFLFAGDMNTGKNAPIDYDFPIKAEDLYESPGELTSASYYETVSIFGSRTEYYSTHTDAVNRRNMFFQMALYRSPYSFTIDKVFDRFSRNTTARREIDSEETAAWGTDRVCIYGDSLSSKYYYIAYPNALLQMQIDIELNPDQIRLIRQRLEL